MAQGLCLALQFEVVTQLCVYRQSVGTVSDTTAQLHFEQAVYVSGLRFAHHSLTSIRPILAQHQRKQVRSRSTCFCFLRIALTCVNAPAPDTS